jgi:rhodanese-related sulfurtransferase
MSYAGDITSAEAFDRLQSTPNTVLIDVRTHAEWTFVGIPDLSSIGKQLLTISWSSYPGGVRNEDFLDELTEAGLGEDQELLFLCRSGARSKSAAIAATERGFTAFNVSDGFEGPLDTQGHRNTDSGWRSSGLPWRQS